MKRASVLFCSLALAASLSGQDINMTAHIDTSSILLGDQIHYRLTVEVPSGASYSLPVLHDTLTSKVMILGLPKRDSSLTQNGKRRITDDYLISSFDEGNYNIAPQQAVVKINGTEHTCLSNSVSLNVVRPSVAPADTTDVVYDIIGPRKAPVVFSEVLPWIIVVLVIALIIWLLVKYLPRNPLKKILTKEKPAEPAHLVAFRELDKLRHEELWQKGEVKEYYSRLSDILRRYIDGRFAIQSPELTTDETVRKLQKSGFVSSDVLSMVKTILADADMVKFAKFIPDDHVNSISIEKSTEFITLTKQADISDQTSSASEKKGGKDA